MFTLHPSGFCCYFNPDVKVNLRPGVACPHCGMVAGHRVTCPSFRILQGKGSSSRPKLFNACSALWHFQEKRNFITFTLPSRDGAKIYQRDPGCPETGDVAIGAKFSKLLEAWSKRVARRGDEQKLTYAWVAESQQERAGKYGGSGDIHYHLVCNQEIKRDNGTKSGVFVDRPYFESLQVLWCDHLGSSSRNCIDVKPIPQGIRSIPSYISKYMGKPGDRRILSRQFFSTHDLSKYQPIHLASMPDLPLVTKRDYVTPDGYEGTSYYFDTRAVLEAWGSSMAVAGSLRTDRGDRDPRFTQDKIQERELARPYVTQSDQDRRRLVHLGLS